jgi:uncharacterized protein YbjT (DUF2867 family)
MDGTILVIGATGMLGRPVAERLREKGFAVRVLSRSPERARVALGPDFEYVAGDVGAPESLAAALKNCRGVHVNLRGITLRDIERVEVLGTRAVAQAARTAGVERLTYLSGAGIEAADSSLLPARVKQAAEGAIRASGVPYTILRATHFMESLDLFVRGKKAVILGRQPNRYHYLAARDYADQVANAYAVPAAAGRALTLLGPEPFSMEEALARYIELVRPDLKLARMPLALPSLIARLTGNQQLRLVTTLFDAFAKIPEAGDRSEADALVGRAMTRLDGWCRSRIAAAA